MKEQFKWGKFKFVSFILLDLACLVLANFIAAEIYLAYSGPAFGTANYSAVVAYMLVIDVAVTLAFNTLDRVLRRRKREELLESVKHVAISFLILSLLLFSTKQGAAFSRVTIYLTYAIYLCLIILLHLAWRALLRGGKIDDRMPTALLVTTFGYAGEGLEVVARAGMAVKGVFITDRTNESAMGDIPTIVEKQDATAFLCWEWIDKVYICGPDDIDVPESLLSACRQMGIPVFSAPARKALDFEVIKIRTSYQKNDSSTGLSFFEGERDIPFRVSRLYTIFESEQDKQRGFHAHKQSWHLLFCPYGSIDVIVDTGRERKTVSLSDPSTGLILHPSVWREMTWKSQGSVLCVAASGHYDADRLRDDYPAYLKFLQEKEWSATIESARILGEEAAP